jgi:hypothetical protein
MLQIAGYFYVQAYGTCNYHRALYSVTRTVLMIVVTPLLQPFAHLELWPFVTPVSVPVFVFTY